MPETVHRRAALHDFGYPTCKPLQRTVHRIVQHRKRHVRQKTNSEKKAADEKRRENKGKINDAVDAVVQICWNKATEIHTELQVLTPKKFYELIVQRGGKRLTSKAVSRWNAYLRKKAQEVAASALLFFYSCICR